MYTLWIVIILTNKTNTIKEFGNTAHLLIGHSHMAVAGPDSPCPSESMDCQNPEIKISQYMRVLKS